MAGFMPRTVVGNFLPKVRGSVLREGVTLQVLLPDAVRTRAKRAPHNGRQHELLVPALDERSATKEEGRKPS